MSRARLEGERMEQAGAVSTTAIRDEPALQRTKLVRWFADRPRIADVLVILVCTTPTVVALIFVPPPQAWLGYLCAAGVAVAFWWRRSHPLAVLLIVVSLATLNPVSVNGASSTFFESIFALFALAAYTPLRTTVLGYLLSQGAILAVAGITILLGMRETLPAVLLQPFDLVALAIGIAVRVSRSRRTAIEDLVTLREDRAAAAERARITAEMHDVVAHSVTVMVALAGGAVQGWEKHPERARAALDQLGTVGAHTLEEMQRILRILRETDSELDRSLESSGYNLPALEELIDVFRAAGLPVTFENAEPLNLDDPALQTTVYRIVQESLTNALRHAHEVSYVEVAVMQHEDQLTVTVTDNGRGAKSGPSVGAGVGLRAMRERAAAFHGQFEAGPITTSVDAPGSGWRTRVMLPLKGVEP